MKRNFILLIALLFTLISIAAQVPDINEIEQTFNQYVQDLQNSDEGSRSNTPDDLLNLFCKQLANKLKDLNPYSEGYKKVEYSLRGMYYGNTFWDMSLDKKYRVQVNCDNTQFDYVEYGFYEGRNTETGIKYFQIFFEGTSKNIRDWLANAYTDAIPYKTYNGTIYVHGGLYAYFEAVKNSITNRILERSKNENKVKIILSGFSQGAAIVHLLNHHFKSISNLGSNPEMELLTMTFGGPGAVYNDPRGKTADLESYYNLSKNVYQMHFGYDFVPYAFTKTMPPEGVIWTIGPYEKLNRISFGVRKLTSSTPLIQERQSIIEEEYIDDPEGLDRYNYLYDYQIMPQIGLDIDALEHFGYFKIFGGEPLNRVKTNFIDEESVSFRSFYTIGNSQIEKNISTLGVITLEKNTDVNLTASRKVILKPGFKANSGSNFRIKIEK